MKDESINRIIGESRIISCPHCQGKTGTKVYEDTVLLNFPVYCPKCGREYRIDVLKFVMNVSNEANA